MKPARRVLIAGAGLAGSMMAIQFARSGFEVLVVERRPDPREESVEGGRSINLALSTRGLHALGRVGLERAVLEHAVPMRGRMVHGQDGTLAFQPYSARAGRAIYSVSRAGLNRLLVESAGSHERVTLLFSRKVISVDLDKPALVVEDELGARETLDADLLVGADGAYSAVRQAMQKRERFEFSQSYLTHGYKELSIPSAPGGGFRMEPEALHIWPRGGLMMIALPNEDGSFTATLFWPFEGPDSFAELGDDPRAIRQHFARVYPDAVSHMPTLVEDYLENPTSSLVTIRCRPWHLDARALLIGDAAHAIVPFYGQGANAAFEDCAVFDAVLAASGGDLALALPRFSERRIEHADALADLALENFIEMRDAVSSPLFRAGKKAGQIAHRVAPALYTPLYDMVTFSRIPYADARARARRQVKQASVLAAAASGALAFAAAVAFGRRKGER